MTTQTQTLFSQILPILTTLNGQNVYVFQSMYKHKLDYPIDSQEGFLRVDDGKYTLPVESITGFTIIQ